MSERNVLLKNVKHPFLVGLHYSFQTADKLYFVLDYINGGEVRGQPSCRDERREANSCCYLKEQRKMEGSGRAGIFKDTCSGRRDGSAVWARSHNQRRRRRRGRRIEGISCCGLQNRDPPFFLSTSGGNRGVGRHSGAQISSPCEAVCV